MHREMSIKIKYLRNVEPIEQMHPGEWYDCKNAVDIFLHSGQSMIIPLGFACELPDGYEAHLAARSSLFKKYGLIQTNGVGVIDNHYCGNEDEWGLPVIATQDTHIPKNTRICQFRIMYNQPACEIIEVDSLEGSNRGGFGSTGEH